MATEKQPPVGGVVDDWVHSFGITAVDPLLNLFEQPFSTDNLWAAIQTVGNLGPIAEAFIEAHIPPAKAGDVPGVGRCCGASTITPEELCSQLRAACKANCKPVTSADPAGPASDPKVAMNPLIASLLVSLIQKVITTFLNRWNIAPAPAPAPTS